MPKEMMQGLVPMRMNITDSDELVGLSYSQLGLRDASIREGCDRSVCVSWRGVCKRWGGGALVSSDGGRVAKARRERGSNRQLEEGGQCVC